MAVNDRITSALILLVCCLSAACNTQSAEEASANEVIELARNKLAAATAKLGATIELCASHAEENSSPVLDKSIIRGHRVSQEELIVALSYLSFRNTFKCEEQARLSMSYVLGTLAATQDHFNKNPVEANEINQGLIYPPVEQLMYEVRYSRLDPEVRQYLEQTVGNDPFELFEALEKNELSPE